MIGDRAYDSDPLDARLEQQYGIELIAPHKSNRSRPKTQDGRKLRRLLPTLEDRTFSCPGSITFAAWSPVGNTTRPTSSVWSSSRASSSS